MKKTYVRILTAVIQVDEDGNEEAVPTCIDIPVHASSPDEAAKKVANAINKLIVGPAGYETLDELRKMTKAQPFPEPDPYRYPHYGQDKQDEDRISRYWRLAGVNPKQEPRPVPKLTWEEQKRIEELLRQPLKKV